MTAPPSPFEMTAQRRDLLEAVGLSRAGKTAAAEAAFKDYLAKYPDCFDGWCSFALLLKRDNRFAQAARAFAAALRLREDIPARNAVVTSLWRAGEHAAAKAQGRMALEKKDALACNAHRARPEADQKSLSEHRPDDARRKPGQKVISFGLWGDNPVYVSGAIINARIAPHLYQGWKARFYCDRTVPQDALDMLSRLGAQVIMMEDPALQALRPMWRFLASDDPEVDLFLCRDADSRLNVQEVLAVEAWRNSGKRFHVMRDHIFHMELMLAGLWGGVAGVLPPLEPWLREARNYHDDRFADQAFLASEIWPLIRNDLCTHDSVYGFPDGQDFPSGYRLQRPTHVGGGVKKMPHWSRI